MSSWKVHTGDSLRWLQGLPDDSADLVFTSPPYLEARTYGINAGRKLEDWTAWMVEIVREATRVCRGLVAVVCEGQTKKFRYLPAPFLLAADLHRAGFNLRKPVVFHRVGVAGSGGPDWLRNDWEPIICVSRPGKLAWSQNTALGKPPRWAPGGAMSHRLTDGTRRNQCGSSISGKSFRSRDKNGVMSPAKQKPSHRLHTKRDQNGALRQQKYNAPAIANPGNVLKVNVGGGLMGHPLAHKNEAPFPLKLAEFFVLSFCRPGGLVLDPFMGSGTTGHAAILHGREFSGCDIRESQAELTERRLRSVTPSMV